jgi:hypothetical protein
MHEISVQGYRAKEVSLMALCWVYNLMVYKGQGHFDGQVHGSCSVCEYVVTLEEREEEVIVNKKGLETMQFAPFLLPTLHIVNGHI